MRPSDYSAMTMRGPTSHVSTTMQSHLETCSMLTFMTLMTAFTRPRWQYYSFHENNFHTRTRGLWRKQIYQKGVTWKCKAAPHFHDENRIPQWLTSLPKVYVVPCWLHSILLVSCTIPWVRMEEVVKKDTYRSQSSIEADPHLSIYQPTNITLKSIKYSRGGCHTHFCREGLHHKAISLVV